MIFDEKKNLNFYRNLGIEGRYAKAVDFLMNTDLAALEAGKHEIDGTNVYANVTPYNPDKDVTFYENTVPGLQAVVKAGQYMIFHPWDAHKPKAADGEPAPIKKVIVKIKED